ncbi:MAG TPA: hypothetical protein VFV38_41645, partial [Ktedonobacteraceae bacterium]|nr:hypothetical protein [Ktedonobacteraceae bacterium]
QVCRVESPIDGWQRLAGQQFVEILGKLAAIGVDVKQPGDPADTCGDRPYPRRYIVEWWL